jgi:hypothetical protein
MLTILSTLITISVPSKGGFAFVNTTNFAIITPYSLKSENFSYDSSGDG